jgi:hypothetical protein
MKAMKTTLIATAALGLVAAIGAQFGGVPAFAQTAAPAAAPTPVPAASSIPVHAGSFSGGKVDSLTYTPSCSVFKFDMDAAAIQESTSRTYVEGEKRRFEAVREKWDAYEDCLVENARRDIDVVRINLGDYLSNAANEEAKAFNGMNAAATGNIERIGKLPAPKAPKKKGEGAAAEAPQAALSAWTEPKGRFVGTLTGSAAQPQYTSACPAALGAITAESFVNENTRNGFNALLDELRAMPDRINQVRSCRQENGQDDYEVIQKVVQDGVNAVFQPSKTAFEKEYAAVRFQLNEHQKPGGLLAPPEMGRAPAKKAPPAKAPAAKKKK